MRIASFNANSVRTRVDIVVNWLGRHRPDVLCLQETKVADESFPHAPFEALGYHVVFRGQKAYNGVALLSRARPSEVAYGFSDEGPADESRLLCVRLGRLAVVNTYVPQGRAVDHRMYRYKLEWFARLRAYFDARFRPDDLLLWAGDMNVAREPMDVHNPGERENHVCYHVEAREAFARCCAWGFTDVFRKHHPEPGHYTFFDYRTPDPVRSGRGWRIDYLMATAPLAEKSVGAHIDVEPRLAPRPSDHVFLVADFAL